MATTSHRNTRIVSRVFFAALVLACLVWLRSRKGKEASDPGPQASRESGRLNESKDLAVKAGRDEHKRRMDPAAHGNMSPDLARDLIAKAKREITNKTKLSAYCADIISALCEDGFTAEAWAMLEGEPGIIRNSELGAFFSAADLSNAELLTKLQGLPYDDDLVCGTVGFSERFSTDGLRVMLLGKEFESLRESFAARNQTFTLQIALSMNLQSRIKDADAATLRDTSQLIVDLNKARMLDSRSAYKLLAAGTNADVFDTWTRFNQIGTGKAANPEEQGMRNDLIYKLMNDDSEKAIGTLLQAEGNQAQSDLSAAIKQWHSMDPKGAESWYQTHQGTLTAGQQTGIASGFFTMAFDQREYDTARQWAERIPDTAISAKAIAALRARQATEP